MNYYCSIEDAISEIDDYDIRSMITKIFKIYGYNPSKDTVDNIDISDLPKIVEGIVLGCVDMLKNDEGMLYITAADYLYYIFYQSKLFPSVRGTSSINIQLRSLFIRYVLEKQIPELIMLFLEQGIFPQFYSATLINEIRNTQFYSFFDNISIDEIIHSVTFGSNDINTTSICITVIDEILEDIMYNKTEDCYEEVAELVSKAYLFKRTPIWMYDELDSTYRKAEITAIFTSVFELEEKDMPIQFDEDLVLQLCDKIYRQSMTSLLNNIVTSFSAHTSEHRAELLDKFVVTNSAFQKAFDDIFSDFVSLFLNQNIITVPDSVKDEDIKKQMYKILLKLTAYVIAYITTEFLWILKNENIAHVTYSLIISSIVREVLCYRVYEVNPE